MSRSVAGSREAFHVKRSNLKKGGKAQVIEGKSNGADKPQLPSKGTTAPHQHGESQIGNTHRGEEKQRGGDEEERNPKN